MSESSNRAEFEKQLAALVDRFDKHHDEYMRTNYSESEARAHKGAQAAVLDQHAGKLACQTCHIPAAARDPKMPTVTLRDWTKLVLNATTGLYGPTDNWENNVKPEYRWWNRWMQVPPVPVGSLSDGQSKIYPWKRVTFVNVTDAVTGNAVYIKAGVYQTMGDVAAAAKKGAEDAKQQYSGQWKGSAGDNFFTLNHQVASKEQALACNACHSSTSILDYIALGYSDDRIKALTTPR